MRHDTLARFLDQARPLGASLPLPADELWRRRNPPLSGSQVGAVYGFLAHYTRWETLRSIMGAGGFVTGCWLAPTAYAACLAPYNLGLNTPRDVCLLVDVRSIAQIWGPGTARASGTYAAQWQGGGIEFYVPDFVPFSLVTQVVPILPCGDTH